MKESKKRRSRIVPICLLLTILGTSIYMLSSNNKSPDDDVIIKQDGINLKMLSSNDNEYGELTYIFEYQVIPENATIQEISLSLTYEENNKQISNNEFNYDIDQFNKTITLICHKAFDKVIILTITSTQNQNASASVKLHYRKKILDLDYQYEYYSIGGNSSHNNLKDFKASSFVKPTYSIYTKDENYTFKPKSFALLYESEEYDINGSLPSTFINSLISLLNRKFLNQEETITAQEIGNLTDDNNVHSKLSKISKLNYESNYISLILQDAEYYCVEKPEITINDPQSLSITFYLDFDFTNFTINTEQIKIEMEEIIF